jgi:hypothetical protein
MEITKINRKEVECCSTSFSEHCECSTACAALWLALALARKQKTNLVIDAIPFLA